jgi:N-methylhydantoinase B
VADSGGAGLHRGGNGIIMSYRFLEPGLIAIHDDRWFTYPWGVNGGAPGARARKILERADGAQIIVGNKCEDLAVEAGDMLHFITWGGGGWGDPLDRDPALVGLEVLQGLVTPQGALSYGVVVDDEGQVDAAATASLRREMRAAQPSAAPLFNYGPPIADLRAASETETGLPAPRQPLWSMAPPLAAE